MSMQRIKHAWARGARIQINYRALGYMGADWQPTEQDDGWRIDEFFEHKNPQLLRIHPKDAHLEYGPVSSELRRCAIEFDFDLVELDWFMDLMKVPTWKGIWVYMDLGKQITTGDALMYMLFLAEMLADEGL